MNIRLYSDGSGGTIADSSSWTAIIYINDTCHRVVGYRSFGTNNTAELLSITDGLALIEKLLGPEYITKNRPIITITSDSEICVKGISKEYGRKANKAIWSMIEYYETIFELKPVHIPRNTTPENKYCDSLSLPFRRQSADVFLQNFPAFIPIIESTR